MPTSLSILFIMGTRPEAIKLAPVILYVKEHYPGINTKVCITAQHRDMLDSVLDFFSIVPDYDLNLMIENQQLSSLTASVLIGVDNVLQGCNPSLVIVQGDTTTAMAAALSAFYRMIKVAHVEAGLRSRNLYEPFPEEINRKIIAQVASLHFAPTKNSFENLITEQVLGKSFVTGNTVIDALLRAKTIIENKAADYRDKFSFINKDKKFILVTMHRRENFGEPINDICKAILEITEQYPDTEFIIPVHPNPRVKNFIENFFKDNKKVHLLPALAYDDLIWIMMNAYFVLTDSGGIQEEAPALAKPVLVLRNVTERMEGIDAGTAILAGNKYENVLLNMQLLLHSEEKYAAMAKEENPYGKGDSSKIICDIIYQSLHES